MSTLEIINIEKEIKDQTFWFSEKAIERYCQSIIKYCKQENKLVHIVFRENAQPHCTFLGENRGLKNYEIVLPSLSLSLKSTKQEMFRESIKRFVFLRHELAHVLYSFDEIDNKNMHSLSSLEKHLLNAFEDSRIETLFGNAFKGSNDYFFYLRKFFWKQEKQRIENSPPTLDLFGMYFIYKFKKLKFNSTSSIKFYEKVYNEILGEFLTSSSNQSLIKLTKKVYENYFKKNEEQKSENPPPPQNKNDNDNDNDNDQEQQLDFSDDQEKEENQEQENLENNNETSELDFEEEEEYSFEKEESEIEQEIQIAFGDSQDQEREIKSAETEIHTLENNAEKEERKYEEILNLMNKDLLSNIVANTLSSDIKEFSLFQTYLPEIIKQIKSPYGKTSSKTYDEIVSQNKQVINEAINYLKLKFQARIKKTIKDNRSDGLIDNRNVFKILIKENQDYKIFFNTLKDIQVNAEAVLLFDFSGSMSSNLTSVFRCMVIFCEVFKALNIKHSIYGFAGTSGYSLTSTKGIPKTFIEKNVDVYKRIFGKNYVSFLKEGTFFERSANKRRNAKAVNKFLVSVRGDSRRGSLVCFKDANTSSTETKNTIGIAIQDASFRSSFSGTTPEFEAVLTLRDIFKNLKIKNKLLFLFNDGGYDTFKVDAQVPKEVSFINEKQMLLKSFIDSLFLGHRAHLIPTLKKPILKCLEQLLKTEDIKNNSNLVEFIKEIACEVNNDYKNWINDTDFNFGFTEKYFEVKQKTGISRNDSYLALKHVNEFFNQYLDNNEVYFSIVESMRKEGWVFAGFGIGSDSGERYLGKNNFQVIRTHEISTKLVQKIKALV